MNIWQVLEITRTSDKKIVKRDYAKLLKLYKPEMDPEGYQHLRDAYDEVIDYCKNYNEKPINNFHNDVITPESSIHSTPLTALSEDNLVKLNDINGLLEVEATVPSTGKKECVLIEGNPVLLTQNEIEKRLKSLQSLKIHPREKLENSVLLARGRKTV